MKVQMKAILGFQGWQTLENKYEKKSMEQILFADFSGAISGLIRLCFQ